MTRVDARTRMVTGALMLWLGLLPALAAREAEPQNSAGQQADLPNIVILLADDLGWNDVSYHGSAIRTPGIDRLARDGVELDRFYVCPVCSPTRAGLMTGRYPIRFGLMRTVIPPWRKFGLSADEAMLPEVLARAGYRHRGIFGKWHLGHSDIKYHPLRRGFTHFYGHYNGAIDYFTHEREGERDWHLNYESSRDEGYSTDLIAGAAARFIEKHARAGPFLCYVPFNAPHSPFQAPDKYLEQYRDLETGKTNGALQRRRRTFAAMVTCMDDGIGRILAAIDRAGIRKNTLVWFFSDNGGARNAGNNVPLRGDKGTVFEGGVRVPAAVRWPARLGGGRKVTAPLAYIDVLPTLMRITGVRDHRGQPLDGLDVLDVLEGKSAALERDLFSYIGMAGEQDEQLALMTPRWKLVVRGPSIAGDRPGDSAGGAAGRRQELFRIDRDPLEREDVAGENPGTVKKLFRRLREFRSLEPPDSVLPYSRDRAGFRAPPEWKIPGL